MLQLLILTDDFTGALDTGVQFVKFGAKTCVTTDPKISFDETEAKVLVIDTETRHIAPEKAFYILREIGQRAAAAGIAQIYKKTDSALRGNIGAELDGLMAGTGIDRLAYIPAFPKLGRYTKDGVLYIDNKPVNESVFGKDLFEPVTESYIPKVIQGQCSRPVRLNKCGEMAVAPSGITVFDARTDEELCAAADALKQTTQPILLAGCAGFAEFWAKTMRLQRADCQTFVYDRKVLILAGSLNPITLRQSRMVKLHNVPAMLLDQKYTVQVMEDMDQAANSILEQMDKHSRLILETVDSDLPLKKEENGAVCRDKSINISGIISANLGRLALSLAEKGFRGTLVVTGGDTLKGVVSEACSFEITLMEEIEPGVILSHLKLDGYELTVVSKSGGMGSEKVFLNVFDYVNQCALRELGCVKV